MSVVDNIKLPPTLLSRFDLIYLLLDRSSSVTDRRLANHIVSLYGEEDTRASAAEEIDRRFLASYISYARQNIHPEITEMASDLLSDEYLKMRNIGSQFKTITATPRLIESFIRLSEAHAKARLSQTVERVDVEEAVRLTKVATQQAATDPTTGKIDMDIIASGISSSRREAISSLSTTIKHLLKEDPERARIGISFLQLYSDLNIRLKKTNMQIGNFEFKNAIRDLEDQQIVGLFGHGSNPRVRLLETKD